MTERKLAMLINPASGRGRGAKKSPIAARRLRERGISVTELRGGSADESASLAREAVREGTDGLIACGGDGTVHLALQAVAGTGTPLGILPVGTGDDNARTFGIDIKDILKAADVIADGRTRTVDLGHVTTNDGLSRYFLGVMSVGFDSEVNERANKMTWPSGQLRYLTAIAAELRVFKPLPFRIDIDDQLVMEEAMLVAVGNGISYGGGMQVCPDAKLDDGHLDLTVLGAVSKLTFLRCFPSVFKGTHTKYPFVSQYRFKSGRIDAPDQIVYADGERLGPVPADIKVVPQALHVFAPVHAP